MIICLIVICYLFGFTVICSVCEYGWFKMVELKWLGYFFTLKLLLIIDIMCVASALSILFAPCWFEHLKFIKICLIDICFYATDYCMLKFVLGNVT